MSVDRSGSKTPVLTFVLLALAIGGAGYFVFREQAEVLKGRAQNELNAVADLKAGQISAWRRERRNNAVSVSRSGILESFITRWLAEGSPPGETRQRILEWMTSMQEGYDYESSVLLDRQGAVRLSTSASPTLGPASLALATESMRTGSVLVSDIYRADDEAGRPIRLDLFAPLSDRNREVGGLLLLRIDPERFLFPLIQSWPTPSATAETVLVERSGDEVVYLNELRHRKGTALSARYPISEKDLPAAMAARGEEGTVEGVDYRGVSVLAAIRKIPDSPWVIIAKEDQREVYAPVRERALEIGALILVSVALAGLSVLLWWRQQRARFLLREAQDRLERQALARHYDYLSRYANDIILLSDSRMRIIEANDRALEALGYTREELLGRYAGELHPPSVAEDFEWFWRELIQRKSLVFETLHQRKDGTLFPVEISARVIETEGKTYYQGIARDLSERRQAEAALRLANERFQQFVDSNIIGVLIATPDGEVIEANAYYLNLVGCTRQELERGQVNWRAITPPEWLPADERAIEELRQTGVCTPYEKQYLRRDGRRVQVLLADAMLHGPQEQIAAFCLDITERKAAESQAWAASSYARNLIEASVDPLVTISAQGKISDVNEAMVKATGVPRDALIGSDVSDHFTNPEMARAGYREAFAKGSITDYPLAIRHVSGTVTDVLYNASVYRDDKGNVAGVLATARDISERKRAEAEITAALAELQQREHETMLVNQMNDMLQSCQTLSEGYLLICCSAPGLFVGLSGGLAIFDKDNQVLDTVAQWGEQQILEPVFTLDDCWALRAGRVHRIDDPQRGLLCHHFAVPPPGGYIGVPLLVMGEVIGVLHLNAPPGCEVTAPQQALASTFAEVVKLALSNIKLREDLREQAIRDPLTRLYNRRYLDETLARELHRALRSESPLCVAMLDIDHFQDFNNQYGHEAGDRVLEMIGALLREKLRGGDLACRYGGEEFTVIMLGTELAVAAQRLEEIRLEVKQGRLLHQDAPLPTVSLSVGIAQARLHGSDPEELLRAADQALYAAKRGGRDRIEVFRAA